jgi:hypothetical protein
VSTTTAVPLLFKSKQQSTPLCTQHHACCCRWQHPSRCRILTPVSAQPSHINFKGFVLNKTRQHGRDTCTAWVESALRRVQAVRGFQGSPSHPDLADQPHRDCACLMGKPAPPKLHPMQVHTHPLLQATAHRKVILSCSQPTNSSTHVVHQPTEQASMEESKQARK